MSYQDALRAQLIVDEGYRTHPYLDTKNKITIGVGRNLTDNGMRDDEILLCFHNDITEAESIARALVPAFDELTDGRKAVMVNMAINLGNRLAQFHETLAAVNSGRWSDAAAGILHSLAADQSDGIVDGKAGARYKRLAASMQGGGL